MSAGKAWRCKCGTANDDAAGVCRECFEWRPAGKAGRATVAGNKLRAGDKVLGYELDANLRPVRKHVGDAS